MKKTFLILLILLFANSLFALNITVTTKLLENVAKDIGGNKVTIHTLVVVSSCPGHADITPSQLSKAKKADFLFYHGFEGYVKKINNPNTINFGKDKDRNLLIPEEYNIALNTTYNCLAKKDPKNKNYYLNRLNKRKAEINKLDKEIRNKTKVLANKKIICSVNNKSLLKYFSFSVVATYPTPDKITPKVWQNIYNSAKDKDIIYCIDNFQSGKDTSLQLSRDIRAKHFYTTNFPGAIKGTETIEKTLRKNLEFCLNGHN